MVKEKDLNAFRLLESGAKKPLVWESMSYLSGSKFALGEMYFLKDQIPIPLTFLKKPII
jgi:hypothetical protein